MDRRSLMGKCTKCEASAKRSSRQCKLQERGSKMLIQLSMYILLDKQPVQDVGNNTYYQRSIGFELSGQL